MSKEMLNQAKVFDPNRKLFEFDNGDKFWMVAASEEEARKCLVEDYYEEDIEDMDVREVSRDEHFTITDESIEGEDMRVDIWNMIDRDATDDDITVPYMAASTID